MIKRRLRYLRAVIRRLLPGRGWRRRMGMRIAWAGLATLMIYFVLNFISTSLDLSRIDRQIAQREQENTALVAKIEQLEGELAYTESDAFVERAAREQLGLAREGETVVIPNIIAREPTAVPQPSPKPLQTPQDSPNWKRWVNALGGDF